jgi:ubiquinone/menaquinone biosynthesis C-methylase UbiE
MTPRGSGPKRSEEDRRKDLLERGTTDHYLDPVLYDFEYRDRDEDVAWYCQLADDHARGGTILELGAGTGRITHPMALSGHRIVAIDRMEPMLQALSRKVADLDASCGSVSTECGEMTHLPVPDSSCTLAVASFNTLMHLYTWEDLLACFREVSRVLVDGGRFAFDVQLPDLDWLMWDPDERHAVTYFRDPHTDERMVYSTNHTYDPCTQVCHVRIYYDKAPPRCRRFRAPPRPERLVHLAHRQIFPEELRMLSAQAALQIEHHGGDFAGGPLRAGTESQVVVCRKVSRTRRHDRRSSE